jgi:tRNA threonylcarbamoyladenosine dehydratase
MLPDASSACPDQRFARTAEYFGTEGFDRVRAATAAVIGLGGVGSHAALCLARNGIGRLLLVDFDVVTESSLNRSSWALPEDVGSAKAESLAVYLARCCPGTAVTSEHTFLDDGTADGLLQPAPDIVVDAIDSLNPKACLLEYCLRSGIPVVSSMGASSRIDPSCVRVGDISETSVCPLARKVRQYLARRGWRKGVTCVYSIETPLVEPGPPDDSESVVRRGRIRRRLPGSGALPGIFGYACAAEALKRLAWPAP